MLNMRQVRYPAKQPHIVPRPERFRSRQIKVEQWRHPRVWKIVKRDWGVNTIVEFLGGFEFIDWGWPNNVGNELLKRGVSLSRVMEAFEIEIDRRYHGARKLERVVDE